MTRFAKESEFRDRILNLPVPEEEKQALLKLMQEQSDLIAFGKDACLKLYRLISHGTPAGGLGNPVLARIYHVDAEMLHGVHKMATFPEGLPEQCWTVVPTQERGKRVGQIRRGELGFYPTEIDKPEMHLDELESLVREMNAEQGITWAQQQAMETGSLSGWHLPAADPKSWEKE